jgi:hypothetical protein
MGRRFAIVIGVAAAGAMALGAQTATPSTGEPVDSTPPDLQLSGDKTQELGNAVKVKASCGDEECTVSGEGSLTNVREVGRAGKGTVRAGVGPASADLGPGETTTLKLKLDYRDETAPRSKTRKKAVEALDKGKKVLAKVKVRATDAVVEADQLPVGPRSPGNVATAKRTIRLVKGQGA